MPRTLLALTASAAAAMALSACASGPYHDGYDDRYGYSDRFDGSFRDRDDNPPGPIGGRGTNWENPPGPRGGPGASPDRPYD